MVENTRNPIRIDLNEFKLNIHLNKVQLTLHFDSPSRRFYLSVIALVVNEMKRLGKIISIPLEKHLGLLVLLNETIGGSTGSSDKEKLVPRIYRKWKDALPDLENAPLFKVLGRKKEYDEGIGRAYPFAEAEKDSWANLFEYQGSEENVRLKFAIDKIGVSLDETSIIFGDSQNADAWDQFISSLKRDGKEESEPVEETVVAESPVVSSSAQGRKIFWLSGHRWLMLVVVGIIAALAIWKLYRPSAPQPEVVPKEKIVVSQPEIAQTAVTPPVEAVSKEKGKVSVPEKISKATSSTPKEEVASREKMAFPLPDVPSIAVLPFVNMGEDPRQEFLCDAITETITTALSKVRHLLVISRQSAFYYKGKPVEVKQVSEELGVRYVLEGSLQRSSNRIRINAQLIDALTGRHIWAELYERDLKDIFALQDEITMRILTAIQVKLTEGEQASMPGKSYEKYFKGKQGLDCYLKIMEGFKYAEGHNIEDVRVARRLAEEAIAVCPDVPFAYGLMGYVHHLEYYLGSGKCPQDSIEKGIEMAPKAIALNDSDAMAHGLLGTFYIMKREYDKAIAEGERSVALAPGAAGVYIWYAMSLNFAGRPEEAIPLFQKAIRLEPFGRTGVYMNLGIALRMTGKFEEAVSAFRKAIQRVPDNTIAHYNLTATYSMMGREKEAREEVAEVLRINPKFSLDLWAKRGRQIYKDESEVDKLVDAMRKAGLK